MAGVLAGMDYVVDSKKQPKVMSMSLGGGRSDSMNLAVQRATTQGVVVVVAAGNSNEDATHHSPTSEPTAITVGATSRTDRRASFSNYGELIDIFAPGKDITSSWHSSDSAIQTISGTSMACPHVSGVAALVWEQDNTIKTTLAVADPVWSSRCDDEVTHP